MTKADGVHSTQGETAPEIPPAIQDTMTHERPAVAVDSFASNLAMQEHQRQESIQRLARLREQASAEVDRLIAFMDASDDYVMTEREPSLAGGVNDGDDREAEDEHDEPSLGWTDREAMRGQYSISECEVDRSDDEPSLGSPVMNAMSEYQSQEHWADGLTDDREEDRCDDEPGGDDEPGDGWPHAAA